MKKVLLVAVMLIAILCTGCKTMKNEQNTQEYSMFVLVETGASHKVVYHKETKVMYAISNDMYNRGAFTLLVNADGTPMLWEVQDNDR